MMRSAYEIENFNGREQSEDVGLDGRLMMIILKCFLGKQILGTWNGFMWPRIGKVG
jgi:hypothetical protein